MDKNITVPARAAPPRAVGASQLLQWPCKLGLVPAGAPYFDSARLLIAADCAAYAYAAMHEDLMREHVTLIVCPRSDAVTCTEKLTEILSRNSIRELCLVCMEAPCCADLAPAIGQALERCGKQIPYRIITVSTDGQLIESR